MYNALVKSGAIVPQPETPPPPVPMDYNWAREVGLIRRPASFVTSMTDERGDELMYSGVKISEVVESGNGIGGVMALLWFQVQQHRLSTLEQIYFSNTLDDQKLPHWRLASQILSIS